ncbi:MAG: radical SAM protein [Planctomycetota bacterium]|jgi:7-carboxy-7-deazaguanine synthase
MPASTLRVNEIFFSIQGESTRAGLPCVFVRLTGCHLRCTYCDTEYAFHEGTARSIEEIVDAVCSHPTSLVEITGGEPLLQPRVHDLMAQLCDRGRTVLLETSGACDISACDPRVIRILDLKTPGSGEADRTLWSNLDHLTARDEVKFVLTGRADYDWAKDVMTRRDLGQRCGAVLMSPVFEQPAGPEIDGARELDPQRLAEWILADGLPVRLQVQLHKHIWAPQTRGV